MSQPTRWSNHAGGRADPVIARRTPGDFAKAPATDAAGAAASAMASRISAKTEKGTEPDAFGADAAPAELGGS